MIRGALFDNVFETQSYRAVSMDLDKVTVSAFIDEVGVPGVTYAVYVNGGYCEDRSTCVREQDYISLLAVPEGLEIAWYVWVLIAAAGAVAVDQLIIDPLTESLEQQQEDLQEQIREATDSTGSAVNTYYGFQNNYYPLGECVPVVYGETQVAPICVQRSIVSNLTPASSPFDFDIAINEVLNLVMIVGHGPIEGFGDYIGKVSNASDFSDVVTSIGANIPERLSLRINNIAGQHVDHAIRWRTGEVDQDPIRGAAAGIFDPYDPGQSYILNAALNNKTLFITEVDKPSGIYAYADRIVNSNPLHYVSQLFTAVADKAAITVLFPRGLYEGPDANNTDPGVVSFRIQYWETDVSGNPAGNVFILPEITLAQDLTTPFSVDFPIALQSATGATYTNLGYAYASQADNKLIQNRTFDTTNPPDAYWVSQPTLYNDGGSGWSFSCWASLKVGQSNGADNFTLAAWGSGVENNHCNAAAWNIVRPRSDGGPIPGGNGGTGDVFWYQGNLRIRLQRDTTNAMLNGSDKIYLTVYCSVIGYGFQSSSYSYGSSTVAHRSLEPIGSINEAVDGYWPSPGGTCHIGMTAEVPNNWGNGNWAFLRAYINGNEIDMVPFPNGQYFRDRGGNNPGNDYPADFSQDTGGIVAYVRDNSSNELHGSSAGQAKHYSAYNNYTTYATSYAGVPAQDHTGLYFGCHSNLSNAQPINSSAGHISQVLFERHNAYGLVRPPSFFAIAAATGGVEGVNTFDIYSEAEVIANSTGTGFVARLEESERSGTSLPNRVNAATTPMTVASSGSLESTGSNVYMISFDDSDPAYYQMEIFRSSEDGFSGGQSGQSEAQVRRITTAQTQDFQYPGVALAAISIAANDQLRTSTPRVTFNVRGRKVPVVKGFQSNGAPIVSAEWSSNPSYIALDLLSDREYGMGNVFAPEGTYENFDLRQFFEWGQFCDEGVPDAYGNYNFYKLVTNDGGDGYLGIYFGITNVDGTEANAIPSEWAKGNYFSIHSVSPGDLSNDWVTGNDSETGLNSASALMEIQSVEYITGPNANSDGFGSLIKVTVQWNRLDANGDALFPEEGTFASNDGTNILGQAGQYERRCSFDGFFDSRDMAGWEAAMLVFKAGRAMPVKLGSRITPVWDRPRDPVGLITQANMIAESLKINYTNPFTRPNSMEVEFNDRDLEYEKNRVIVDHISIQNPDSIDDVRKERKYRRGVVRRSQILRDAYYQLNKLHLQRRQYEFKVGPDALHLLPGDRLLLSHDIPSYGTSGRLAADFFSGNTFPSPTNLINSVSANGGPCVVSIRAVIEADSTAPPNTDYSTGTAHAYSVPTVNLGAGYVVAGNTGSNGYESLPSWASQHVAVANGFYPTPDYSGGILSPLGRITFEFQKVEFSLYVKEPDEGASPMLRIGIFRLCDDSGYVEEFEGAKFSWSSGALSFDSYDAVSGSSAMSYHVSAEGSGWYRVAIMYDNGSGAGAAGVGDYVQARCYFSYSTSGNNETFQAVADGGRGNQFLKFGDPLDINTVIGTASPWTKANASTGSNAVRASATEAPPYYPDDTTADTVGDHGYVVQLIKDGSIASGTTPPLIRQEVTLPTGAAVSSWNGERICMTGFARLNSVTTPTSPELVVNIRSGTSVDSNGIPDGDGVKLTLSAASAASSWTAATTTVASSGTVANVASSVAPVRLNSSTNSTDWVQWNVSFDYTPSSGTLTTLLASLHSDEGGSVTAVLDVWGLRLHGAGGTSASPSSGALVNSNVHIGHLMWGAQFIEDSSWSGSGNPTFFATGGGLVLDRDITLEAGKSYEAQVRSSSQVDMVQNTEVMESFVVAEEQIPSSGSTVIRAGTKILVTPPQAVAPLKGDLYAIGEVGNGIKDIVIESVTLDPKDLTREIAATDYDDGFYNDTEFSVLDSATESYGLDRNSGTAGDMGYGSSSQAPYPFSVGARYATQRNRDGGIQPYVDLNWTTPELDSSFAEVAVYWSRVTSSGVGSKPVHIATVRAQDQAYRYMSPALKPGSLHRFTFQRIGKRGSRQSLKRCPRVTVKCQVTAELPTAPSISVSYEGFRQIYEADSTGDNRVHAIEGRIGGWIVSSPGFILDPDNGASISDSLVFTSQNAAGNKHVAVYARSKLANGQYGVASEVLPASTLGFQDGRSTADANSEDDYATEGVLPLDLAVASGELHWSSSSTSLGPVYYEQNEIDLTNATRAIASCVIQGYQTRPETLADLEFQLGSDLGRRWSIEGPMDVTAPTTVDGIDLRNASVRIQWRYTSGSSLSGVDYQDFIPQEVYFRKAQFRLVFERPTDDYDTYIQRMSTLVTVTPLYDPSDLDGGTF